MRARVRLWPGPSDAEVDVALQVVGEEAGAASKAMSGPARGSRSRSPSVRKPGAGVDVAVHDGGHDVGVDGDGAGSASSRAGGRAGADEVADVEQHGARAHGVEVDARH